MQKFSPQKYKIELIRNVAQEANDTDNTKRK